MNILEKRVENQVQFWSLLGPFILLLAIAILLFKMASHWYLPLSVLVGVPLCVKWKMKGLAVSLFVLFTFFVFSYSNLDLEELYWHVGMGMAIALSFVILTLSLEELKNLVGKIEAESQGRLENFLRLDENVKVLEHTWTQEKEHLLSRVQELSQTLGRVQEEKQTFQKLVYLAKDELIVLRTQHEHLLQDLMYKKQHIAQLNERVEENEITIQTFVNSDAEQHVRKLTQELSDRESQLEICRSKENSQEEQLKQLSERNIVLEDNLQQSLNRETQQVITIQQYQQEQMRQLETIQEKHKLIENLGEEKTTLASALTCVEKDSKQQKEFVNQLLEQLNEVQRHAREKQEEAEKLNGELKETHQNLAFLQVSCMQTQKQLDQKVQDVNALQQQHTQLETKLKNARTEIELKQNQLVKIRENEARLPYGNGNTRRIEAMYLQLKEQFQEKSAILDATRQMLFHAEEKLLAIQKDEEERQYCQPQETEVLLHQDMNHLSCDVEEMQQEIDALHRLVGDLLKQVAGRR